MRVRARAVRVSVKTMPERRLAGMVVYALLVVLGPASAAMAVRLHLPPFYLGNRVQFELVPLPSCKGAQAGDGGLRRKTGGTNSSALASLTATRI